MATLFALCVSAPPTALAETLALADSLRVSGKLEEAANMYRKIARDHPSRHEPHFFMGLTARALERPDDAVAHYHAALALAPDLAEAHMNVASCYSAEEYRHEEAHFHYQTALTLRSWPPALHAHAEFNSALALDALERDDEAVSALRRSQELDPSFEPAAELLKELLQPAAEAAEATASRVEVQASGEPRAASEVRAASEEAAVVADATADADDGEGTASELVIGRCPWESEERADSSESARSNASGTARHRQLREAAASLQREVRLALAEADGHGSMAEVVSTEESKALAELVADLGALLARSLSRK